MDQIKKDSLPKCDHILYEMKMTIEDSERCR